MPLLVGVSLALAVGLWATGLGLDRDRGFYPTVTIVIASYYALFAVMGASTHALVLESLVGAAFLTAAALGFRRSLWLVVGALAAHSVTHWRVCLSCSSTISLLEPYAASSHAALVTGWPIERRCSAIGSPASQWGSAVGITGVALGAGLSLLTSDFRIDRGAE